MNTLLSEKEIENIIVSAPWVIEKGFQIIKQQKRTKVGIIDIFGKDIDDNYVIVELKKNKSTDVVVGQISRYMGVIQEEFNVSPSKVRGIILCESITQKLKYATKLVPNIIVIELKNILEKRDMVHYKGDLIFTQEFKVLRKLEQQFNLEFSPKIDHSEVSFTSKNGYITELSIPGEYEDLSEKKISRINEFPTIICKLKKLEYLNLDNNNINYLNLNDTQLMNLETLYLNWNKLKELPKEIQNFKSLKDLSIIGNKLNRFPEILVTLPNLKYLDISNNPLIEITSKIGEMKNLKKLSIDYEQLQLLPIEICDITVEIIVTKRI